MPHVMPRRVHTPADRVWAAATLALAAVALVLALAEQFDASALVAFACVLAGGWSMLVSRTTGERFETAIGTVLGAVVLATSLAYGSGFSV